MIRLTRLQRFFRSSGTGTRHQGRLNVYLCRIVFEGTPAARTFTCPVWAVLIQNPPKWIPNPASRTFSLKNWPYGDGPV
jgi:hypothetical protein